MKFLLLLILALNGEFLGITTAIEQELVGVAGPAQHLPESAGTTLDQSLSCPQPIVVDQRRAWGPNAAADVASSVSGARSESSHPDDVLIDMPREGKSLSHLSDVGPSHGRTTTPTHDENQADDTGELTPSNDQCPICIAYFQPSESVPVWDCKHGFHVACINRWINHRWTSSSYPIQCPICQVTLTKNQVPAAQTLPGPDLQARAALAVRSAQRGFLEFYNYPVLSPGWTVGRLAPWVSITCLVTSLILAITSLILITRIV